MTNYEIVSKPAEPGSPHKHVPNRFLDSTESFL